MLPQDATTYPAAGGKEEGQWQKETEE